MSDPTRKTSRSVLGTVLMVALIATACGGASTDPTDTIEVTGAWARSSPMMAMAGAAYMTIVNHGDSDDALLAAAVADTVAGTAEIHETRPAEGEPAESMGDGEDTAPLMEMVHVERIDVPAGATVVLEPGGLHVMLLDLVEPLTEGAEIELTLTFETAGEVVVTAVVGDGPG